MEKNKSDLLDPVYGEGYSKIKIGILVVSSIFMSIVDGWLSIEVFNNANSKSSFVSVLYYATSLIFAASAILLALFPFVRSVRNYINGLEFHIKYDKEFNNIKRFNQTQHKSNLLFK